MVKKNQPEETEENGTGSEEEEDGAEEEVDSDESESEGPKAGDKTKPTAQQKGTEKSKPKRQTEKNDGKGLKGNKKNNVIQKDSDEQLDEEGTSDDDSMEEESTDEDLTEEESNDSGENQFLCIKSQEYVFCNL